MVFISKANQVLPSYIYKKKCMLSGQDGRLSQVRNELEGVLKDLQVSSWGAKAWDPGGGGMGDRSPNSHPITVERESKEGNRD